MNGRYWLASGLLLTLTLVLTACQVSPQTSRPGRPAKVNEAAAQHLDQAELYLDRGLTDAALAAFGFALEENPRITEAHMGMGHIYREHGNYELAAGAYERAVETDPANFDANYYLALMKQMLGQVRESIAVYLRALAIRPESFEANRDLAAAYLQVNEPEQALAYARRATESGPDSAAAWSNLAATHSLMGQYEEAVQAYREALERTEGPAPDPVLLGLADANIKLANYDRAINVLEQLISRSPSSTAYERLGYALFKSRRFDESLQRFRQGLALDPNDSAALNGVGVALMTQYIQGGRSDNSLRDQAVEAWRRSLQVRPGQPRIIDLLARARQL